MESLGSALASLVPIFLHGFLGRPSDWSQTALHLKAIRPELKPLLVDYFSIPALAPQNNFDVWGQNFSQWVRNELGPGPHPLIGYSLGGRLALHALENSPDLFNHGILISTNPGLASGAHETRSARVHADEIWSRRFLTDSWNILIQDWNKQAVFNNSRSQPESRLEVDYQRPLLAQALVNWSLGRQKDFRPLLRKPRGHSLTWVTGRLDLQAMSLQQELLADCPDLDVRVIEQAGHRILFDAPEALAQLLCKLML